ncbi:MAG: hypothetical protein EXR72_22580 [Myxococcales bacterium]|nr:hypothetical protein [Myxococcales bacterium]
MRRFLLVPLAFLLDPGCFGGDGPTQYRVDPGAGSGQLGAGKIFIQWTLAGQPPSPAACTGVDHLDVRLETSTAQVTISPVPCTLTRFRFDGMPEGPGNLLITGFDASGCRVTSGAARLTVVTTQPTDPSPTVALSAITLCR